jgi:tetratricopeptide (TPR) repeat protein
MKSNTLALLLLVFGFPALAQSAKEYTQIAHKHALAKDYAQAIVYYDKAIAFKDNWEMAYFGRANAKLYSQDLPGAIEDYSKAIALKPKHSEAYSNRGVAKLNMGDSLGALQDYKQATRLDKRNVNAYQNTIYLLRAQKKYEEAIKELELLGKHVYKYHNYCIIKKSEIKAETKDFESALADLDKLVKKDPRNHEVYQARAQYYQKLGNEQAEMQEYEKAIQKSSNKSSAYFQRGLALFNKKKFKESLQDFEKVIALQPQNAPAYENIALIYINLNEWLKAAQYASEAIRINPNNSTPYLRRGVAYLQFHIHQSEKKSSDKHYLDKAVIDLQKALEINPKSAYTHFHMGLAEEILEKYPEAIASFSRAIYLNPNNEAAYRKRALLRLNMGETEAAMKDYEKASKINPFKYKTKASPLLKAAQK